MIYLTAEEVLVMHARILDATSGAHGVRDAGLLASILEKPKAAFGGEELYQGVFPKAAAYLEAFANYQVFVDGNKRTAFAAAARYVYLNGYALRPLETIAIESFMIGTAKKQHNLEDIAKWLERHSARRAKRASEST